MDYILLGDILWYIGHVLPVIPVVFTLTNYYTIVTLVLIGLFMTLISRPIGRL